MLNRIKQVFIERTIPIKCDFCPYSFLDAQGILECESGECKLDAEIISSMFKKIYGKNEENKKNERGRMRHFLKLLWLGLYNLIIVIECVLSFYLGVRLFIEIHNTTGFAAIGMFFGGIVLIFISILFLYLIGFVFEYFMENRGEKKEDSEEE